MFAVYKKELKSYFTSMIGFVFMAFFLFLVGLFFMLYNLTYYRADFTYVFQGIQMFFVLLVPVLTMRIIAEENRQKTDQLLYTSPVSVSKLMFGKYLALVTLYAISMLIVCFYPLILGTFGTVDFAKAYGSIVGFFLLGSAYISIGFFISSLTESQVIAAVVSFAVMIFTVFMSGLAGMLPSDHLSVYIMIAVFVMILCFLLYLMVHNVWFSVLIGIIAEVGLLVLYLIRPESYDGLVVNAISAISITDRYSNFELGIFDISALIYYISICFVFVFLTIQRIKKKRWS